MIDARTSTLLIHLAAAAFAGSPITAQVLNSSTSIASPLQSAGWNCTWQYQWNQSVPIGPLAPGVTQLAGSWQGLPGVTLDLGASSLDVSADGVGTSCPWAPIPIPSNSLSYGTVEVFLSSPYDTDVEISISGYVNGGGVNTFDVSLDGAYAANISSAPGVPHSTNQTLVVNVGPTGVALRASFHCQIAGYVPGQTGIATLSGSVSWSQLDAAAVTAAPGGCAPPTATPTFAAAGLPIIGSSIEADILQAQGPSPIGFAMFGLEQATTPLDSIGMPGCVAMQTLDLTVFAQPTGTNALHVSVPLPNDPGLAGVMLYSQAFTQALGSNALGLVAGDGLHWRLGT